MVKSRLKRLRISYLEWSRLVLLVQLAKLPFHLVIWSSEPYKRIIFDCFVELVLVDFDKIP
jgi:hypothetical protein